MTGIDVLEALRRNTVTAHLRVIAMSASAMPEQVSEARAAGAMDYWTKPIEIESFCSGLASVLRYPRGKGLQRELDSQPS